MAAQSVLPAMAATVREIDPGIATFESSTMEQRIHDSQPAYLHRASTWLVGSFAVLALVLSVVGLYGVIAYSVSQRTREIGVRMALGAQRATVYQLVLREAAWLIGFGIAAGLVGALGAATLIRGLLFGTQAWDRIHPRDSSHHAGSVRAGGELLAGTSRGVSESDGSTKGGVRKKSGAPFPAEVAGRCRISDRA